jgi:streptomycin 6-kinase
MPSSLDRTALATLGIDDAMIRLRERLDGENARMFLADLPALAAQWQQRLGLTGARIMPGGVLSAVLLCRQRSDGVPVALKLSAAHAGSALAEAAAPRAWAGIGAPGLRWASEDGRVIVLDVIQPGTPARPGNDEQDAQRAGALIGMLHRAAPDRIAAAVPTAERELGWRFDRAHTLLDGPSHARALVTHADIDAAHQAALELHRSAPATVLCHGDLVNKNILLDKSGDWWAIDPRPCRGDPCLDAAFWAVAHRPGVAVRHRCALTARACGLDADRVWAWARVFAISEAVLGTDASRARAHHAVARAP